eukprot:800255-Pyramimonas_sp.AAC.1
MSLGSCPKKQRTLGSDWLVALSPTTPLPLFSPLKGGSLSFQLRRLGGGSPWAAAGDFLDGVLANASKL